MKFLVVFGALCIGLCLAEFNKQQMRDLLAATKACYTEMGLGSDADLMQRIIYNKDVTYTQQEMDFIFCGLRKLGWMDADGNVLRQAILDFYFLNEAYDRQLVEEVIDLCISLQLKEISVQKKAIDFYRCTYTKKRFDL